MILTYGWLMDIAVVGLGYVGLSNAVLLAQHNRVVCTDISEEKIDQIKHKRASFKDDELNYFLNNKKLDISATLDAKFAYEDADIVIIATPTNYNEKSNFFDTDSVETVIQEVFTVNPRVLIVIKSTVPVGFTDKMNNIHNSKNIIFSPEFLRENNALKDNLYPSRIVIGGDNKRVGDYNNLLRQAAIKKDVKTFFMSPAEAEAVKLFSNTFLAMRVAFFNELDSYAMTHNLDSYNLIKGVSKDARIGDYYNNPSFGYGGYCLPKDTKQLLANYEDIPQNLIGAIVNANETRKDFIADKILKLNPKTVGIYRLVMRVNSDNFRESAILGIIERLSEADISIVIYEPSCREGEYLGVSLINDIEEFKASSDIIIANRVDPEIENCREKIFSRDLFGIN